MGEKYYSQFGQDKWLYENLFKNKLDGFFIEVGADDGIDKSNTFFFENLGWKGICIEPSPIRFKLLRKNRKCVCENVAILNRTGKTKFLDIQGWGKGLSGVIDSYNDQHKERIKLELINPQNKGEKTIKVKVRKMQQILNKHKVKEIDFCSIDVEGSEIEVLKSIDFSLVSIKVLMIENNYNDPSVKLFLKEHGYRWIKRIEIDDIYILD